jgi:hypothetical protein
MTRRELLTMLLDKGLTVAADRDALIVGPKELLTNELRAAIRANKLALLAALSAHRHYRWCVTPRDGTPFEVCCLPEMTAAEMQALYPTATVEPLPASPAAPTQNRNSVAVSKRA